MRRKLFTLAAAVSAVLCIAVCALWVRSYWRGDLIEHGSVEGDPPSVMRGWGLLSAREAIGVRWVRMTVPPLNATDAAQWRSYYRSHRTVVGWRWYRAR